MPAAADDDHVVGRLGVGLAPGRLPVAVALKRVPEERKRRIFPHCCLLSVFGPSGGHYSPLAALRRPLLRHRVSHARPPLGKAACRCRVPVFINGATRSARQCRLRVARDKMLPLPPPQLLLVVLLLAAAMAWPGVAVAQGGRRHRVGARRQPAPGHRGNGQADRRVREADCRQRRQRCAAGRDPAASSRNCRASLLSTRRRLPAAAGRNQRAHRAARAAARRGPAAGARHRHRASGRTWLPKRPRSTPCSASPKSLSIRVSKLIDQHRRDAQRPVPQRADQALRADPTPSAASCWRDVADRSPTASTARCRSWLRFVVPVQAAVGAAGDVLRAGRGGGPAGRRPPRVQAGVRCRSAGRGSVLSQPAVGGLLVDAAADRGGRRRSSASTFSSSTISTYCAATSAFS